MVRNSIPLEVGMAILALMAGAAAQNAPCFMASPEVFPFAVSSLLPGRADWHAVQIVLLLLQHGPHVPPAALRAVCDSSQAAGVVSEVHGWLDGRGGHSGEGIPEVSMCTWQLTQSAAVTTHMYASLPLCTQTQDCQTNLTTSSFKTVVTTTGPFATRVSETQGWQVWQHALRRGIGMPRACPCVACLHACSQQQYVPELCCCYQHL